MTNRLELFLSKTIIKIRKIPCLDIGTFLIEVALECDNLIKRFTVRDEIDNMKSDLHQRPGVRRTHLRAKVCT